MRTYTIGLDVQTLRPSDSQIHKKSQTVRLAVSQTLRFSDSDSQTFRLAGSQTLRFSDSDSQSLTLSDSLFRLTDSQILRFLDSQILSFSIPRLHTHAYVHNGTQTH